MKFFIVFALCVAAASARFIVPDSLANSPEIQAIIDVVNDPNTDPDIVAGLILLLKFYGVVEAPTHVGPAIVDEIEQSPIAPGPVIVEENEESPIHVGPAIIDEGDLIDVGPAIVEPPSPSSSPLVQIIVNVKSGAQAGPNPVEVVDASPAIIPEEFLTFPGPRSVGH